MLLVPLFEPLLSHIVIALDACEDGADTFKSDLWCEILARNLVAELANVLDFLARGLDKGNAECGGGSFEEVTKS